MLFDDETLDRTMNDIGRIGVLLRERNHFERFVVCLLATATIAYMRQDENELTRDSFMAAAGRFWDLAERMADQVRNQGEMN